MIKLILALAISILMAGPAVAQQWRFENDARRQQLQENTLNMQNRLDQQARDAREEMRFQQQQQRQDMRQFQEDNQYRQRDNFVNPFRLDDSD